MRSALINQHGVVTDIYIHGEGHEVPEGFTSVPSESANVGDKYDGASFIPPDSAAMEPAQLRAFALGKAKELLGTSRAYDIDGVTIRADATSATLGDLLRLTERHTPDGGVCSWVCNDGSVTLADGDALMRAFAMAEQYEASVYAALANVLGDIDAGMTTTPAQIASSAWPL